MELTSYAAWLNDVFSLFDTFFLGLCHELALSYGDIITPIAMVFDRAGHWGIAFIVLSLVLMCFRKTRMAGFAILVSIAIAGGISELFIKDVVARPRPFETTDLFNTWWQFVGSPDATNSSFPSGHVAATTAAMIALAYAARRWWVSLLGVLVIVAMAFDRMYLQVHYPSDVLAGFILGFAAGIVGYAIVQGIWRLLGKHPDQIAAARARDEAIRTGRTGQMTIPRGPDRMEYAAVGQADYMTQAQQTAAIPTNFSTPNGAQRYADNTVPQTLETSEGNRVVVPPMPTRPGAAMPQPTQAMPTGDAPAEGKKPGNASGLQMAEEYYEKRD